jgi:hypothetical protein
MKLFSYFASTLNRYLSGESGGGTWAIFWPLRRRGVSPMSDTSEVGKFSEAAHDGSSARPKPNTSLLGTKFCRVSKCDLSWAM